MPVPGCRVPVPESDPVPVLPDPVPSVDPGLPLLPAPMLPPEPGAPGEPDDPGPPEPMLPLEPGEPEPVGADGPVPVMPPPVWLEPVVPLVEPWPGALLVPPVPPDVPVVPVPPEPTLPDDPPELPEPPPDCASAVPATSTAAAVIVRNVRMRNVPSVVRHMERRAANRVPAFASATRAADMASAALLPRTRTRGEPQ